MGDMADLLTEQQEQLVWLHEVGDCGDECPYCEYAIEHEEGC